MKVLCRAVLRRAVLYLGLGTLAQHDTALPGRPINAVCGPCRPTTGVFSC